MPFKAGLVINRPLTGDLIRVSPRQVDQLDHRARRVSEDQFPLGCTQLGAGTSRVQRVRRSIGLKTALSILAAAGPVRIDSSASPANHRPALCFYLWFLSRAASSSAL